MLNDGKMIKTTPPFDFDSMSAQFATLREDVTKLTHSAEDGTRKLAHNISDSVNDAVHFVERKGIDAEAELKKTVASHPMMALGLAAGLGLLIGAMTRR